MTLTIVQTYNGHLLPLDSTNVRHFTVKVCSHLTTAKEIFNLSRIHLNVMRLSDDDDDDNDDDV